MLNLADLFASEPVEKIVTGSELLLQRHQSIEEVFDEIPVSLEVFIRDKAFLGERYLKLSPKQSEAVKQIERVLYAETYPKLAEHEAYWGEAVRLTNYHVFQWGKSSGKDTICRLASLRVAYILGCLKSPQEYFMMAQDDSIHMLNVAISADQAQKAFFEPLTKMVSRGWFKDKATPTKNAIEFTKNIQAISGHSKTDSQEGLNIILGICDEIDGFRTKEELARTHTASVRESSNSAESIMEMMQTSANSRFPETFKFVAISWPRYVGSTIQVLTNEYKKDIEEEGERSVHYASGPYATWEVRTDRFRSQFNPQYKKDARTAAAKYECKPSFSINPYFRNEPAVRECMYKPDKSPIEIRFVHDGHVWTPVYEFSEDFYPVVGAIYSMHADLAIKNDRAGIALCHQARIEGRDKNVYEEDGTLHIVTEYLPYVKADFVISYDADLYGDPPREIQIQWALDLWQELKNRGFNIRQFSYDGFQSTHSRQLLVSQGVESPLISTDRSEEPWKGLRDLLYMGRISIPHDELLISELLGLTKRENGKIDHQAGKSKDMADALACASTGAIMLGGQEDKSGTKAYYSPPEFHVFEHKVDILEGTTLEQLEWGTDTHDPISNNMLTFDFEPGLF